MKFIQRNFFWLLISLTSLFVWIIRWIPESFIRFYNIVFISWDYYPRVLVRGSMYTVAAIGMVSRLLAVLLAMFIIYLVWKGKISSNSATKFLGTSIVLEGVYFASLIPSIFYLFALGVTRNSLFYSTFGVGYFLQVILTVPFLWFLGISLYSNKSGYRHFQSYKLLGITFFGYIGALWANSVFHWFGLMLTEGISVLWNISSSILAFNTLIVMSLAFIFAFFGGLDISKKRFESKWVGAALTSVGLHFLIYLIYQFLTDSLISVWLTDIWAIGLLALGLAILKSKTSK
ncbi:MAG: hypothetical protein IAX21_01000 [Candidatus Bathyarchaeota archaeon]|nr:MAG: hypothetical protein IAX21_01000 [Candidatus Bathyarchaeota archaeon]